MSQSVPLSKLLPRYNAVVESFQERMQHDNVKHIDNMLSLYTHSLQGGCSDETKSYMEKKLAARDDYNNYRTQKDAEEWMAVDKKLYSYLGRDMNVLTGGIPPKVPSTKEPQLVQSLKLLSAYIHNLVKKSVSARRASKEELLEAINELLKDPDTHDVIKQYLRAMQTQVEQEYEASLDQDARDLVVLEEYTVKTLAPSTSSVILRTGLARDLPPLTIEDLMAKQPVYSPPKKEEVPAASLSPQSDDDDEVEQARSILKSPAPGTRRSLAGGADMKFRSSAAQHLYNIISQ